MPTYRLGKQPPVTDARTLEFSTYVKPQLPAPPASIDYGAKVSSWPMYGNDQYGDCTCAAAGHMIQNWTANAQGEVTPPESSVIAFYEHFVGTPGPEAGCNMLSVLRYWRKSGLDVHKITAFAAVGLANQTQAQQALWLFGSVYIGVALPDFAVTGDMPNIPWVVPPGGPSGNAAPNPQNGHCIPAVAYDGSGLTVVTWGQTKSMSWDFYQAYADESFAVLSNDFLDANDTTVAGFDLQGLERDLSQV